LVQAQQGTSSRPDGSFTLPLSTSHQSDTLLLSCLGYTTRRLPLTSLDLTSAQQVLLHPQSAGLAAVAVTARKWPERAFGVTSARALVHFTDGTLPAGQAVEIAQLMRTGSGGAVLTSANLYLAAGLPDSVTLALRFYRVEGERPTTPLLTQVIRQRVAIRPGWLRLDLTPYGLFLPQDFVLGVTLTPSAATQAAIPYEIKLGGPAKSFARPAGSATWRVPPHHYRLYVTARVPPAATPTASDNQEPVASHRLYSPTVQDSFFLFVRLPKGYSQHPRRHYPIVVLLDANVYLDIVHDELRRQQADAPFILVGVGYRDAGEADSLRQRDDTYPVGLPADSLPVSGGGRRFLTFLQQELLPYIDHTYRTQPSNRALLGHSLGGYLVLYALAESLRTGQGAHYVAASPTLYYHNQYVLQDLATLVPAVTPQPTQLFVSSGARELTPDTAEGVATATAFRTLVATLASRKFASLQVQTHVYPGYGHLETAVPTFVESLQRVSTFLKKTSQPPLHK
jgi:predicted alpha/beta superfamily hydrolase